MPRCAVGRRGTSQRPNRQCRHHPRKNSYIADSSTTYLVGEVGYPAKRLVRMAYEAMWRGIAAMKPGARLGDIGHAIAKHAHAHGYAVVKECCGHGIGREMHEDPQVLHHGRPGPSFTLREGMAFASEPMLNQGGAGIVNQEGEWPVYTRYGRLSAKFEHTVAATAMGARVLTLRPEKVTLCPMH